MNEMITNSYNLSHLMNSMVGSFPDLGWDPANCLLSKSDYDSTAEVLPLSHILPSKLKHVMSSPIMRSARLVRSYKGTPSTRNKLYKSPTSASHKRYNYSLLAEQITSSSKSHQITSFLPSNFVSKAHRLVLGYQTVPLYRPARTLIVINVQRKGQTRIFFEALPRRSGV